MTTLLQLHIPRDIQEVELQQSDYWIILFVWCKRCLCTAQWLESILWHQMLLVWVMHQIHPSTYFSCHHGKAPIWHLCKLFLMTEAKSMTSKEASISNFLFSKYICGKFHHAVNHWCQTCLKNHCMMERTAKWIMEMPIPRDTLS